MSTLLYPPACPLPADHRPHSAERKIALNFNPISPLITTFGGTNRRDVPLIWAITARGPRVRTHASSIGNLQCPRVYACIPWSYIRLTDFFKSPTKPPHQEVCSPTWWVDRGVLRGEGGLFTRPGHFPRTSPSRLPCPWIDGLPLSRTAIRYKAHTPKKWQILPWICYAVIIIKCHITHKDPTICR